MRRFVPRWLLWTLVALVSWGVWTIIPKLIGEALTAAQSQALSTVGLLPVMAALVLSPKRAAPGRARRGIASAVTAGVLAGLGNVAYYHALNLGGKASTVTPLSALYPLVTVVLALVLLGERLNRSQTAGIGLSLAAIYLFNVQDETGVRSAWLLYALIPIGLWGAAGLLQKVATNHLSGEASTLWFLGAFAPVAVAILLTQPWPGSIAVGTWLLVAALGLSFALGNYGLLAAFASGGKASIVTPLSGLYPVVTVPLAVAFLGESVGRRELAAIAAALLAVAALSYERPAASAAPEP
jgi:uncharacterized membrane protein